jgi:type I restriction enzyme S subunit
VVRNPGLPIPLLAEQKRIVAKVDELMTLCDTLEAAQQNRNTLRQGLRVSALDALMNATSDTELETAWAFVRDNWAELSRVPEDVEGLRQAVLQIAMRGRIVPQDVDEKSASVLLEKIRTKRLTRKAKTKIVSVSIEEEGSLARLPEKWVWCRVADVATVFLGSTPSRKEPKYWGGEIPWLVLVRWQIAISRILIPSRYKIAQDEAD